MNYIHYYSITNGAIQSYFMINKREHSRRRVVAMFPNTLWFCFLFDSECIYLILFKRELGFYWKLGCFDLEGRVGRIWRYSFTSLLSLLRCIHLFFPPPEEVFLGTTSPRIDFVGTEGGLTFFAGFCVDDEFVRFLSDIVYVCSL